MTPEQFLEALKQLNVQAGLVAFYTDSDGNKVVGGLVLPIDPTNFATKTIENYVAAEGLVSDSLTADEELTAAVTRLFDTKILPRANGYEIQQAQVAAAATKRAELDARYPRNINN